MTHYLKQYSKFNTIAEMDEAAEMHAKRHWDELTKSDRQVLDVIRRYSVKYGAAHLKHGTIEEATGKSNITVRRAIWKLVKLEIIEKVHYIRPVMSGLGANIYIILPFNDHGKMNDRDNDQKPRDNEEDEQLSKDEALLSKSLLKSQDLNYTSPVEPSKLSTSLSTNSHLPFGIDAIISNILSEKLSKRVLAKIICTNFTIFLNNVKRDELPYTFRCSPLP